MLTTLDLDALACYSEAFSTWRDAVATLERKGATYISEGGLKQAHSAVAIAQAADKAMLSWAGVLALTPAAFAFVLLEVLSG